MTSRPITPFIPHPAARLALLFFVLISPWMAGGAAAQESPFAFGAEARRLRAEPERGEIRVFIEVPAGHYLYREEIWVEFPDTSALRVTAIEYPKGKVKYDKFLEREAEIYEHPVTIRSVLELRPGAEFPEAMTVIAGYRGCTAEYCFFPEEHEASPSFEWKETGGVSAAVEEAEESAAPPPRTGADSFDVAARIASKGLFLTYLGVFFAGILLSFTPCVFPMVPITLAIIGARGETKPARGFTLSLSYVLGMALTYATLGLVAASTGALFGAFLQNPIFILLIASIFITLAISMFGVFELQIPPSIATRMQGAGGGGSYVGIFLMGIVAGLIASPCVGPVLVGLLVYIAQTGNALLGFTLLFTLAMGIGVIFLVVGTSSGMIGRLPGAGLWMDRVKQFFGFVLLLGAAYFARTLMPDRLVTALYGILLLFGAAVFGLFDPIPAGSGAWRRVGKAVALLVAVYAVVLFASAVILPMLHLPVAMGPAGPAATIAWGEDHDEALERAAAEGRPVMIDFTADWCAACKELEHYTYTDPSVIDQSRRFEMVMIDATRSTDEVNRLRDLYGVRGLPTVVFIGSDGERIEGHTVTGFVEAEPFLQLMKSVE
ncbi:MAG: protein-disulfide reductase DsbD [Candidatus Eisenbacteria bacterium]